VRRGIGPAPAVSWFFRRSFLVAAAAIVIGIGSVLLWPGDPKGESLGLNHWLAIAGFAITAGLLVVAAVSVVLAVVGGTWASSEFDPNQYLDDTKRDL